MKARPYFAVVAAAALAAASGCLSIDRCDAERLEGLTINGTDKKPVEHIVVSNFGYYLFNIFPLVSGNASQDRWFPFRLFSDHVELPKMQSILAAEVQKRHGLELAELASHYDSAPCFTVSLDPKSLLGLLFCYREVQLSAVLVESGPSSEASMPALAAAASGPEGKEALK